MKKLFIALQSLFVILVFGCSTKTVVLMEEYEDQKILGKDLTIVRLFDKPFVSNIDDIVDDLGSGVPLEVYDNYFNESFITFFKTSKCFKLVDYHINHDKLNLTEQTLSINDKEKMKFFLPEENTRYSNDGTNSDFVLFIDDLSIMRGKAPKGYLGSSGDPNNELQGVTGSFASSGLYQNIYFVIWDNSAGKLVSYGRVEDQVDVMVEMTKGHWDLITQNLGRKILKNSPFSIRSAIYNND